MKYLDTAQAAAYLGFPRGGALGWPCIYECPSPAHGCNAYMGCWCP